MQDTVNKAKEIRGSEIFELVYAAADIFAASIRIPERTATVEEFRKQCDKCGKIEEIFSCLGDFQQKYIQEQAERYENDTIRPVRKAKEYIQNHFSDPLTLEEVSEMVGLSTAYFSALFKKTEGEGFAKYLINVRMATTLQYPPALCPDLQGKLKQINLLFLWMFILLWLCSGCGVGDCFQYSQGIYNQCNDCSGSF